MSRCLAIAKLVRDSLKNMVMLTMIDVVVNILAEDFFGGPGFRRDFVMLLQCRLYAAKTSFDVARGPASVRRHLAFLSSNYTVSLFPPLQSMFDRCFGPGSSPMLPLMP